MITCQIFTDRLQLAPFRMGEAEEIHRLWIDPGVRRYLWDDEVISPEQAIEAVTESVQMFQTDGTGLWSVRLRDHEELIGFTGYWFFHDPPELQLLYGIVPTHWGKGLAPEAAGAIIRYGFEEKSFDRIVASTDTPNNASVRVMEKLGMKFLKRETRNELNTIFYDILANQWQPGESSYKLQKLSE